MAARGRGLHRQAGRRHRHRSVRGPGHSGDRRAGRPFYVLQRTANYASPARTARWTPRTGARSKENYREIWRQRARRVSASRTTCRRTALSVSEGWSGNRSSPRPGRAAGSDSGRRSTTCSSTKRRTTRPRSSSGPDPRAGARPGGRRAALTARPPVLHQAPATRDRLLRDLQPRQRDLVDLRKAPIQEITPTGVRTADAEYPSTSIVYATGFDAMTGPLFKLDIRGRDGPACARPGPRTAQLPRRRHSRVPEPLLSQARSPSALSNMLAVHRAARRLDHRLPALPARERLRDDRADPRRGGRLGRTGRSVRGRRCASTRACASWYLGENVPGKVRVYMPYGGGVPMYRETCKSVARAGSEGFVLTSR